MKRFFYTMILAAALAVGFTSCSKEDDPDIPAIAGIENAEDNLSMAVGESITFTASVTPTEQTEYQWTLDGQEVSTELACTFAPKQTGESILKFTATNVSGTDSREFTVSVVLYKGGFFVINEGSFGRTMGSVDYFADASTRTPHVYQTANPGKELGNTTEFGTKWNGNYYFVSKQDRTLVKASATDFVDGGEYSAAVAGSDADGRSFAGIDENYGVYTTSNGAYVVDLNTFKSVSYLEGSRGVGSTGMSAQCGGAITAGDYIFVINVKDGVYVYSKADRSLVRSEVLCPAHIGFVQSKDGNIWASDGPSLYCINPKTLAVTKTDLPDGLEVYSDQWAWKPAMFDASATENVLYFASAGDNYAVQNIYRYQIGDASSLAQPFATGGANDYLYGGGFRVDPVSGDLVATFVGVSWGDDQNKRVVFDGKTGAEKSRLEYQEYLFPTMVLFN